MNTCCLSVLCILLGLPALAQESCPTSDDLQAGIRVEYSDGARDVYARAGNDRIGLAYDPEVSGTVDGSVSLGGVFEVMYSSTGSTEWPDTNIAYVYDFDLAGHLPLQPGATGSGTKSEFMLFAKPVHPVEYSFVVGPKRQLQIGSCSYQAMEFVETYVTADLETGRPATEVLTLDFLPELGFLVTRETRYADGTITTFTPVGITKVQ